MAGYSPGWNDPPPVSYSPCNVSSSAGKRNLLNRRVPFPLNQPVSSPQPDKEKNDDSVPLSSSPVLSKVEIKSSSNAEEHKEELKTTLKEEEILPYITDVFEKILSENSESCETKRIEEINNRLKVMKDSWSSKISAQVKQKMFVLAQELSQGNAEAALNIQCILMVDYLREVKQWMVAVKHIIEMERQKSLSSSAPMSSE